MSLALSPSYELNRSANKCHQVNTNSVATTTTIMSSSGSSRLFVEHKSANHHKEFTRHIEGDNARTHICSLLPHLESIKSEINEYLSVLVEKEKESKKSVLHSQASKSVVCSKPPLSVCPADGVTEAKRLKGGK